MSKRWLVFMLLVSVAFNLAVLGSFIYLQYLHPYTHDCPPALPHCGRPDGDHPGMPLRNLLAEDEQFQQAKQLYAKNKGAFIRELAQENYDEAELRRLMETSLLAQGSMERRIGNQMIELRKTMSTEEAREFFGRLIEQIRQRQPHKIRRYRRTQ